MSWYIQEPPGGLLWASAGEGGMEGEKSEERDENNGTFLLYF